MRDAFSVISKRADSGLVQQKMRVHPVAATLAALLLSACGGAGSSPPIGGRSTFSPPPPPPPSHFAEFTLPPSGNIPPSSPSGIALGPDGNVWFTDTVVDKIGRITPVGQITEFALVGANVHDGIAAGSDGNLWFTAGGDLHSDGSIGKITPSGAISLFPISAPIPRLSRPGAVTAGPDQNLWFTASICTGRHWFGCASSYPIIGKMTPNGAVTEFRIPNEAAEIAAGPDGNLWFVEGNAIGRMTMSGRVISEFLVAVPSDSNLYMLGGITTGPDHNIWVTQTDEGLDESKGPAVFSGKQNVYRITPWGAMTAFSIPPGAEVLVGQMDVTAGSDGKLWFTDSLHNAIGSITTDGVVTEFPIPTPSSQPGGITAGPNGTLWFTETNAGKIGRLTP